MVYNVFSYAFLASTTEFLGRMYIQYKIYYAAIMHFKNTQFVKIPNLKSIVSDGFSFYQYYLVETTKKKWLK